jgi:purine-nucleoside phosphorylase
MPNPNPATQEVAQALLSLAPQLAQGAGVGLVLGSGWGQGPLVQALSQQPQATLVNLESVAQWPKPKVQGHGAQLLYLPPGSSACPAGLMVLLGRLHAYEGHTPQTVAMPIGVMGHCGVKTLILTNAAGGINDQLSPGDWMVITDHLNLTGQNPSFRPMFNPANPPSTFVDMSEAYNQSLRERFLAQAHTMGVTVRQGVYAGVKGPHYETPAEIRMLRTLGADAVGMSTVLETLAAKTLGMAVLGLSCISNKAAGLSPTPLSHAEVLQNTQQAQAQGCQLLLAFLCQC